MARDLYETLGVAKDADEAAIKAAYRKLVKKHHPDLNPGNKEAEQRFRDLGTANDILSDKDKRAAYDRGEIDATGQPRAPQQPFYRDYAQGPQGARYNASGNATGPRHAAGAGGAGGFAGFDPNDPELGGFSDIFSSLFRGGRGGFGRGGADTAPENSRYTIEIEFLEAARGGKKRVSLPDGRSLDLTIPEGIDEGQQMRLKGQGAKGANGQAGDALVEVHIRPHPSFTRDGNDIRMEVPIGIHESALGARISVPTIRGPVEMAIPKGASTGSTLRLKGKGIKAGDQLVKLRLVMPPKVDPDLEKALGDWAKTHAYDPRAGKGGGA